MDVEKAVDDIVKSADRLARAAKLSRRDEKWWAFMEKEFWALLQLSWALRGVILRRGEGIEGELHLSDQLKKQLEEILKEAEVEERLGGD